MNFIRKNTNNLIQYPYFLLLLISVIAYWQIAFVTNSVQWDMLDCHLPWRYFVSNTIQNGQFPWWNPYQQLGYPIHADLRTVWNPFVLFISLFGIYTNYTLHFFLMLYLFLAGSGMYKLMLHFTKCKHSSLITAAAYILSGFFISHTQEISAFAGAAFIPFTLLYYLKFFDNLKFINILKTSFFLFMMLSCAYPALTIILVYLLFCIFLFFTIPFVFAKNTKQLLKILLSHSGFIILMIALSSVFIVSFVQVAPYVGRISGLSIQNAQFGSLTPQAAVSFLFPFAVVSDSEFIKTDITMSNAYFGIIMLIFFCATLLRKRNGIEYLLLFFGLISLLASFGEYTPVRNILYNYVPLMDKFRFPSFFTLFSTIIFLILAGISISELKKNKQYKSLILPTVIIMIIILVAILYSFINLPATGMILFKSNMDFWDKIKQSTLFEHIFIQGIIQLVIIGIFLLFILKRKGGIINLLFWLIVAEMIVSVQLNMYYTGVSKADPSHINQYVKSCKQGFVMPGNSLVSENTSAKSSFWPLWRNTTNFTKQISFDSYNSFVFKGYEILNDSFPNLKEQILKNRVVYLSDKIFPYSSIGNNPILHDDIYVADTIFSKYENQKMSKHTSDDVEIIKFLPNEIIVQTNTSNKQILTFLQSNYYGWNVFIDNVKTEHFTSNYLTMSVILPEGKHNIMFKYSNPGVKVAFIITFSVFGLLMLFLLFNFLKNKLRQSKMPVIVILLLTSVIIFKITSLSNKQSIVYSNTHKTLFASCNDFEKKYSLWQTDTSKLKYFQDTNIVYQVDSTTEFCSVLEFYNDSLQTPDTVNIMVQVKTYLDNVPVNSALVLSLERGNDVIIWKASGISDTIYTTNIWNKPAIFVKDIILQKNDIIKTYIWNKNRDNFLIDDFKIEIYK